MNFRALQSFLTTWHGVAEVLAGIGEKLLWLDTPALSTPGSRAAKMNELRRRVDRNGMDTTALDKTCFLPSLYLVH